MKKNNHYASSKLYAGMTMMAIGLLFLLVAVIGASCNRNKTDDTTTNTTMETETDDTTTTEVDPIEETAKKLTALYRAGLWNGEKSRFDGKEYWVDQEGFLLCQEGQDELSREILGSPAAPTGARLSGGFARTALESNGLAAFAADDFTALYIFKSGEEVNRIPVTIEAGYGTTVLADGDLVAINYGEKVMVVNSTLVRSDPLYTLDEISDMISVGGKKIKVATFSGENYVLTKEGPVLTDTKFVQLDTDVSGGYKMKPNPDGATYTVYDENSKEVSNDIIAAASDGWSLYYVESDHRVHSYPDDHYGKKVGDLRVKGLIGWGEVIYPIVEDGLANDDSYLGYQIYNPYIIG